MTRQGKQKIEYTLATHAIEKLIPSQDALHLCELMTNGILSADAAVSTILSRYGLKKVNANVQS